MLDYSSVEESYDDFRSCTIDGVARNLFFASTASKQLRGCRSGSLGEVQGIYFKDLEQACSIFLTFWQDVLECDGKLKQRKGLPL